MGKRTTRFLPLEAATEIRDAVNHAAAIGTRLNQLVTMSWPDDIDGQSGLRRALRCMREWLRRHGEAGLWVWVHEQGPSGHLHTHVALHLPSKLHAGLLEGLPLWFDLPAETRLNRREDRRGGSLGRRPVVRWRTPCGTLDVSPADANVVTYLTKDARVDDLRALGIPAPPWLRQRRSRRSNMTITGKRGGSSRLLGAAARGAWAIEQEAEEAVAENRRA